ncbi:XRE family transcriptional regulator [Methylobacterium sp. 37f]|nr:XRE family transcriptional regulator [Methylobacterium sp. 37f]
MVGSDEGIPSGLQAEASGPNTMTPAQSRAARALLNWSESDLAGKLGLGEDFVRNFESGGREAPSGQIEAMRSVFMTQGILFSQDGGSDGVCLSEQGRGEGTRVDALNTENDR